MEQPKTLFVTPVDPRIGDLVWHVDGATLLGPHLIVDVRHTGYGSNRRKFWVLFDAEENAYHYSERRYLKIPKERL